jgi:predicted branched-subunit amino acid permease
VSGAVLFALIFGTLAVANGLMSLGAGAMSVLVYAGSAQFIAAGLVASGAGVGVIVFTTFVLNLHHMLCVAALAVAGLRSAPNTL